MPHGLVDATKIVAAIPKLHTVGETRGTKLASRTVNLMSCVASLQHCGTFASQKCRTSQTGDQATFVKSTTYIPFYYGIMLAILPSIGSKRGREGKMNFYFVEQTEDGRYQACGTHNYYGPIFRFLSDAERFCELKNRRERGLA